MPLAIVEHNSYSSVVSFVVESITIPQVKPFSQGVTKTFIAFLNADLLNFFVILF